MFQSQLILIKKLGFVQSKKVFQNNKLCVSIFEYFFNKQRKRLTAFQDLKGLDIFQLVKIVLNKIEQRYASPIPQL
ncbi:unnamed protein product [Paramecium octaurelia]|uniref:Uncharacterized protein n=1 Tax=Paramecium octaurelia TaxID=43137 RepID=A0A8S1SKG5_PAROT|nr:unnamed protein product [Paramecium octaurelia]